ncbi:hypothetical protein CRENPOLYSF2_30004 [Crenothrix polyspora]|uniref:Uncharacterized protein n=1 Tax=Crenothrix polyspora TaxID=360316 RepID=A0A1R4H9J9_9GAMM|nr:hypothetical protein CRENPOLYSF2_30004 [Crenothrix polyspora]
MCLSCLTCSAGYLTRICKGVSQKIKGYTLKYGTKALSRVPKGHKGEGWVRGEVLNHPHPSLLPQGEGAIPVPL